MGGLGRTAAGYAGYAAGARIIGGAAGGPIGAIIGTIIGGLLFPARREQGPKEVAELKVSAPQKGQVLPLLYGMDRIPGHYIWKGKLRVHEPSESKKGKGIQPGKNSDQVTTYSATLALALCEGIDRTSSATPDNLNAWQTEAEWSGVPLDDYSLSRNGYRSLARWGEDAEGNPMFYMIALRWVDWPNTRVVELYKISKTTPPTLVATLPESFFPASPWVLEGVYGPLTVSDGLLFTVTFSYPSAWYHERFIIFRWDGTSFTQYLDNMAEGFWRHQDFNMLFHGMAYAENTGYLYFWTRHCTACGGLEEAFHYEFWGFQYGGAKNNVPIYTAVPWGGTAISFFTHGWSEIGDDLWWSIDFVDGANMMRLNRRTATKIGTPGGEGGAIMGTPWTQDGKIYCAKSGMTHPQIPDDAIGVFDGVSAFPVSLDIEGHGSMDNMGSISVRGGDPAMGGIAWVSDSGSGGGGQPYGGGSGWEIYAGATENNIPATNSPASNGYFSQINASQDLIYVFTGDLNNGTIKHNGAEKFCQDLDLLRIFAGDDVIWDANNPALQTLDFTLYKGLPGQQPDPVIAAEIAETAGGQLGPGGQVGSLSPLRMETFTANGSLVPYTVAQPPIAQVAGAGGGFGPAASPTVYYLIEREGRETYYERVYLTKVDTNPVGDQFTVNYETGQIVVGGPYTNTEIQVHYQSLLNASGVDMVQEPLAYPHTAYIVLNDYPLGPTTTPPNFTFEVFRAMGTSIPCTGQDINPVVALRDFLTHDRYGLGLVLTDLGLDLSTYESVSAYVDSEGLFCSPYLASSESGLRYIEQFLAMYDGFLLPSQGKVKFGVRKAETTSRVITFSDYTMEDMVTVARQGLRDTKNRIIVQFADRAADYNPGEVKIEDDGNILSTDERLDNRSMPWIKQNAIAMKLALRAFLTLNYQKLAVSHGLDPKWGLLEPGDLYTINDEKAGLSGQAFRVITRTEDPAWGLRMESVEEPLAAVADIGIIPPVGQVPGPWFPGLTPVETSQTTGFVVEVPYGLIGEQRYLAVFGYGIGSGWLGADVSVSRDGLDYIPATTLGKSVGGVLTGPLFEGLEIDFDQTVDVDLLESAGALMTTSREGFWALQNLLLAGVTASTTATSGVPANPDVEFLGFEKATLVSGYRYTLQNFLRGVYNTPIVTHYEGTGIVQVATSAIRLVPFLETDIGKTLYFKFTSLTQFPQSIVVTPTYLTYSPRGLAFQPNPISGLQLKRGSELLGSIGRY